MSAVPRLPPAPGRFSTTTGWPSAGASFSESTRAIRSGELPAGKGTIMWMARDGQFFASVADCADPPAAGCADAPAARASMIERRRILIWFPPLLIEEGWREAPGWSAVLVQEQRERAGERRRLLEVGQMRGRGDDHQLRSGERGVDLARQRDRRACVLLADDYQRRALHFLQPAGQVDLRNCAAAAHVARNRRRADHRAHARGHLGMRLAERVR